MVSGCHFGDCHYIFGNERAVEQFEKTMNVVKLLGIEEGPLAARVDIGSGRERASPRSSMSSPTRCVRLGPSPFSVSDNVYASEVPEMDSRHGDGDGGELILNSQFSILNFFPPPEDLRLPRRIFEIPPGTKVEA